MGEICSYEELITKEAERQQTNVELIASENFPSERILKAAGSILTNKYAEGYPGKRYYGGCEWIDRIEQKAIDDACALFNCKFANVQPHCGSSANQAIYRALLKQGDTVMGMDLGAGGHLTHGHKMSFSGQDYHIVSYGVDEKGIIDIVDFKNKLNEYKPRMVIIGASSYSQIIDYKIFKDLIDEYNQKTAESIREDVFLLESDILDLIERKHCYYMVDMAHVAGLVAGGVHPNPCEYADVVTSTTHKTLRGPRGGLILWNDDKLTKKINNAVFPGVQGGPLEHIICAKGICFEEAKSDAFKEYAQNIVNNAFAFAEQFKKLGWKIISNGTQNHMFVLDVYDSIGMTGKKAEKYLDLINITVNKNQIPNDTLSPMVSSGIRIGTPAMTTKGWKESDFKELANIINDYLNEMKSFKEEDINDDDKKVDIFTTVSVYKARVEILIKNINNK